MKRGLLRTTQKQKNNQENETTVVFSKNFCIQKRVRKCNALGFSLINHLSAFWILTNSQEYLKGFLKLNDNKFQRTIVYRNQYECFISNKYLFLCNIKNKGINYVGNHNIFFLHTSGTIILNYLNR